MKRLVFLSLAVLCISAVSFGSTECQSRFGAGSEWARIAFCVTVNGNIALLDTDVRQIGDGAEGYALCGGGTQAWDLGLYGDSGNWLPAVITQPHGPDTFPLSIARSTTDGRSTIIQTFSISGGGKNVHVKMVVTGAERAYRFAHVQLNQQNGDHGTRSSFAWSSGGSGLLASPAITPRVSAGLMTGGKPVDICSPTGTPTLPYAGDSALLLAWILTNNRKNSISFDYIPMR